MTEKAPAPETRYSGVATIRVEMNGHSLHGRVRIEVPEDRDAEVKWREMEYQLGKKLEGIVRTWRNIEELAATDGIEWGAACARVAEQEESRVRQAAALGE